MQLPLYSSMMSPGNFHNYTDVCDMVTIEKGVKLGQES